jgi:hypothetical protein
MFNRITRLSLGGISLLLFFWILHLAWVKQSDLATYRSVVKEQQVIESGAKSLAQTVHQTRSGVRKDIWYAEQSRPRLHYKIVSERSILTLIPSERHKVDIVESLEKIQCWMQDKVYDDASQRKVMQQVRYFEANTGSYQYSTQQFLAHTVSLSLFRFPGQELPPAIDPAQAFLRGVAKDVSFSVSGKTPQFQAQNFKATLAKPL